MSYRKFRVTGWNDGPGGPQRFTVHGLTGRLWNRKWNLIDTAPDLESAELVVKQHASYPHMAIQRDYSAKGDHNGYGHL